ncbi:uncharacterized protein LOC127710429 [Mytilus californianus]|uniref:uncharacterized protein LOC127710429 n=1 Tax=Mytilus californianus TaxID=6549 RepID=UPI0022479C59|nr:uncharacterized protein LOC127710429 [Mytilus californianus]
MVMAMIEQLNKQDEHIRSQNERILEQQRRLNDQDIQIHKHDQQINEVVEHISELQESAINEQSQFQSMRGSKISPLKHTEPRVFVKNSSHSFIDYAVRQSIKSMTKEKTGNRKERSSFTKRSVTGVYVFIWTVASSSHSFIYSQMVINSYPFGAIFTDSDEIGDYHTSTGNVVAELNQGDVVYIRTHPTDLIKGGIWSHDNFRTYFNGWKL